MPVSPPFSIWSNLFTCPQASGNFRHAEVSLDGLFASPPKIWCDHPAAPPSLDWLIHLSDEHGVAPLPLLRTWSGLLGLPDPSSSPAAANEDRLSPPTFTIYLYYATFTTLLLYYFTPTTYLYSSFAPPSPSSSTFTIYSTTPPSLLDYFTTSLLLLTLLPSLPSLAPSRVDGWRCPDDAGVGCLRCRQARIRTLGVMGFLSTSGGIDSWRCSFGV